MLGVLLAAMIVSVVGASCYGFGCCGVIGNMVKCGCSTGKVCLLFFLGTSAALFMSFTIYHAGTEMFGKEWL